jgi:hypothetical protein
MFAPVNCGNEKSSRWTSMPARSSPSVIARPRASESSPAAMAAIASLKPASCRAETSASIVLEARTNTPQIASRIALPRCHYRTLQLFGRT